MRYVAELMSESRIYGVVDSTNLNNASPERMHKGWNPGLRAYAELANAQAGAAFPSNLGQREREVELPAAMAATCLPLLR